jgi:hypothetical protein
MQMKLACTEAVMRALYFLLTGLFNFIFGCLFFLIIFSWIMAFIYIADAFGWIPDPTLEPGVDMLLFFLFVAIVLSVFIFQ